MAELEEKSLDSPIKARLYVLPYSHPSMAARAMLVHKGIDHRVTELPAGAHPPILRVLGFPGGTVPAAKLDGRRVQGSREIARSLDELRAEPPLFPTDPSRRRAVEEAERWGEEELQPLPRRFFRWGLVRDRALRAWFERACGTPAPGFVAAVEGPVVRIFARKSHADDETVKHDLRALPGMLDRVDSLIAEGALGGEAPNAADFQIASSIRVFMEQESIRPLVEGRPATEVAIRLFPDLDGPIPLRLPAEWLPRE